MTSPQTTIVITQSNYIPWRGYFNMLAQADIVVFLDSVQYTRRDWRNRNIIKGPNGPQWLTIPVEAKGRYLQSIDETRIAEMDWAEKHIRAITTNYRRAAAFEEVSPWLFDAMREAGKKELLTACNCHLLKIISERLGITTPMRRCVDVLDRTAMKQMDPTARLVRICQDLGATRYLSGPAAKAYLDISAFEQRKIDVAWMNYDGYAEYAQCWGEFDPHVSIIDLLLNCGSQAARHLLG